MKMQVGLGAIPTDSKSDLMFGYSRPFAFIRGFKRIVSA
jgi:hypothetical protein